MTSRPLVLFTHYYPFGDRELFLETEILYLKEVFSTIVIVPNSVNGLQRDVPEGVIVETSFAETYCGKDVKATALKAFRAMQCPGIVQEFYRVSKTLPHIKKLLGYASEVTRCTQWLRQYLRKHPELQHAIFYTYWFYDHTTAITLLKKEYPHISVISRAHGFDLYEEDYPPPYLPFRSDSLQSLDKLFLISGHGEHYVKKKFPQFADKTTISKLGIEDPGFTVNAIKNSLTLVSCSHLVSLKRVNLQIEGVSAFAKQHPNIPIHWFHIGDGPLRSELFLLAKNTLPPSVEWQFLGHFSNKEVFSFYKEVQPDLFLLMSETEGLPVSIMEANACGIPAMATAVGGVSEIVNADNGILLSSDPSPDEIAGELAHLWQAPKRLAEMKIATRLSWEVCFHAETNYRQFASLVSLVGKEE